VLRADHEHHLVAEERTHDHASVVHVARHDGEIELAFEQRLDRARRRVDHDLNLDAGIPLVERPQQRRQPVIAGVALRAHAEDAGAFPGNLPDVLFGAAQIVEDGGRRAQHPFARGRDNHALAHAVEQRRPEPGLDVSKLVADGGLGEVQSFRGARDAAMRGDFAHEPEMPDFKVHVVTPG
jgi:hypothetical protein